MQGLDKENFLQLLRNTKISNKSYNGQLYDVGYHSLKLDNVSYIGQRDCQKRLDGVPYDFSNKVILDIGCNQGGMIFILKDKIKYGIGIDYDRGMINVCNKYKNINKIDNVEFYNFDLEKDDLTNISYLLRTTNCDIIFLLSVCMWVKNWQAVIDLCSEMAPALLFETNGNSLQQESQEDHLKNKYKDIILIKDHSEDDILQKNRKLFLCYAS